MYHILPYAVWYSLTINMHQGCLDCKGADGTSRRAKRIAESPGLVKPDDADAPNIIPEPPPDSSQRARER